MRGHFRSRDKDDGHTIRSATAENLMLHANFMTHMFYRTEVLPIEVFHCGNSDFRPFLIRWPWPWPDDLHMQTWPLYTFEIYRMCENELPTSRLSKVVVLHTCIHTPPKLCTTPLRGWYIKAFRGIFATHCTCMPTPYTQAGLQQEGYRMTYMYSHCDVSQSKPHAYQLAICEADTVCTRTIRSYS